MGYLKVPWISMNATTKHLWYIYFRLFVRYLHTFAAAQNNPLLHEFWWDMIKNYSTYLFCFICNKCVKLQEALLLCWETEVHVTLFAHHFGCSCATRKLASSLFCHTLFARMHCQWEILLWDGSCGPLLLYPLLHKVALRQWKEKLNFWTCKINKKIIKPDKSLLYTFIHTHT